MQSHYSITNKQQHQIPAQKYQAKWPKIGTKPIKAICYTDDVVLTSDSEDDL